MLSLAPKTVSNAIIWLYLEPLLIMLMKYREQIFHDVSSKFVNSSEEIFLVKMPHEKCKQQFHEKKYRFRNFDRFNRCYDSLEEFIDGLFLPLSSMVWSNSNSPLSLTESCITALRVSKERNGKCSCSVWINTFGQTQNPLKGFNEK